MKHRLISFSVLLIFSLFSSKVMGQSPRAEDHLIPEEGIFGDFHFEYHSRIRQVLFKGFSPFLSARFVITPSFDPERVLCIEMSDKDLKFYIHYRIAEKMIWSNDNWERVTVKQYKRPIDRESAELIASLFTSAINQTRYNKHGNLGLDGVSYHFTVVDGGSKSGMIWSPSKDTKMDKLVKIGNRLIDLAKAEKTLLKFDKKFIGEIESLKKLLE